jgi:hypothetical protein
MLRRSLLLSLLLACATCGAQEVPAGEPMAAAKPAAAAGGAAPAESTAGESAPGEAAQGEAAQEEAAADGDGGGDGGGDKTLSGMSILGNQEAPKSLVIVPWKSSELGDTLGLQENLDDSRQPVDKQVFMRELAYYEIRSGAQ